MAWRAGRGAAVRRGGAPRGAIAVAQDFNGPLPGSWTTTTANGGVATVNDGGNGLLTVSPLQTDGEQAYVSTVASGGAGGHFFTEFDVTFNTHFITADLGAAANFNIFAVYGRGNNPLASLNVSPSDYNHAYIITLGSGIEYGAGTQTSTDPYQQYLAPSVLEGKTFHVIVGTNTTFNGGTNWTIDNTVAFTRTGGPNFILSLTRTGNAVDGLGGYDPRVDDLTFGLGDLGFGNSGTPSLPAADFTGNVQFDNFQAFSAVPEPASLGLLGLGGLVMLKRRK
jgi:hypothetical protein